MASQKTMMNVVLDVSSSMRDSVSSSGGKSNSSKLELATAFVGQFIMQRMMASKTGEFGVVTFGDNITSNYLASTIGGYEWVNEVVAMERATVAMLNTINAIPKRLATVTSSNAVSDLIDGIVVGQDILVRVNAGKAFNRVMLLITDGETPVTGVDDLEQVILQMQSLPNFALYIAMIGDCDGSSSKVKRENKKLLQSLTENLPDGKGRFQCVANIPDSIRLLSAGLGLGTKPQCLKTVLEMTPNVRIPCYYWSKVSVQNMPPLKKCVVDSADGSIDVLKRDTSYRASDRPDEEVAPEDRVKGYRYGDQWVPFSAADELRLKIPGTAGFQVICSIPSSNIPRHHLLEGPMFVSPQADDEEARYLMSVIILSLRKEKLSLLTRSVKRDNADPFLVVMEPLSEDDQQCSLLTYRLPCANDIRDFNFPSLVKFSSAREVQKDPVLRAQKTAMSDLVDAMTIKNPTPEMFTPINAPLCAVHRDLYKRLVSGSEPGRADADVDGLAVTDTLVPPAAIAAAVTSELKTRLSEVFPLKLIEKAKAGKKKVFWSDIQVAGEVTEGETGESKRARIQLKVNQIAQALGENAEETGESAAADEVGAEDSIPDFTVGSPTPLEDFSAQIAAIRENFEPGEQRTKLLVKSHETMTQVIERNITVGANKSYYRRAIEYLSALRIACVEDNLCATFNTFLRDAVKEKLSKGRHTAVWDIILEAKLTLVSTDEASSSTVSGSAAASFLLADSVCEEKPIVIDRVPDEDDDLLGEMA